jgi:hypothetical protein
VFDVTADCLSDFVFSDPAGEPLVVYLSGQATDSPGCTDEEACNYDLDATVDDGSCDYPEENFNCNGECVVEVDCAGECGGDLVVDECGECNGDGIDEGACDCAGNVEDCAGECGGDSVVDECGECGGDNSSCTGCTDPEALNYDSDAIISCDDCCDYPAGPHFVVDLDSTG